MSTKTVEFLQRYSAALNDSPARDVLLPALLQVRETCFEKLSKSVGTELKSDKTLGCRWCLNSWSLGQYTVRVLPQKRPRGFRGLRAKAASDSPDLARRRQMMHIGHNFLSMKCDVCLGITKIPALKPVEIHKAESPPPVSSILSLKKKKKNKKRDDFAGLNPTAVKASQKLVKNTCEAKKVLDSVEVLSPSSIQNGVNIVSNRSNKNRSAPSVSGPEKPSIIKQIAAQAPNLKLSKSKKKKVKTGIVEKPKKSKNVTSALATFLNSL
ncbi:unnamed protein product [Nesidiocoris tenuis]|uniref:Uncharacterized protein n=1 Tax=Nesidiocoris tenuis TaxID=355587 RepID=A0A6H5H3C3_9HEMI|nr:unnamed protein product [Nesidiocoris tenuis]